MLKGDAEYAGKHQHGVQVKETGVADVPVSEARIAALEERVKKLEAAYATAQEVNKPEAPKKAEQPKKEKAA